MVPVYRQPDCLRASVPSQPSVHAVPWHGCPLYNSYEKLKNIYIHTVPAIIRSTTLIAGDCNIKQFQNAILDSTSQTRFQLCWWIACLSHCNKKPFQNTVCQARASLLQLPLIFRTRQKNPPYVRSWFRYKIKGIDVLILDPWLDTDCCPCSSF